MTRLRLAVVAVAALLPLTGCGRSPADLLLTGGTVITLDPSLPRADTVAVSGGRILFVGSVKDASRYRGSVTRVIQLDGKTIVPGFIDTHVHLLAIGDYYQNQQNPVSNSFLDLSACDSPEAVAALVAERAAKTPKGQWIIGKGWSQVSWQDGRFPASAEILNRAAPDHPVFLTRVDAHAAWVNRTALKLGGIRTESRDPPGGQILRDARGRPTGVLVDRAVDLVLARMPGWNRQERKQRFKLALDALAAAGLTTVHAAGLLARPGIVWTENGQTQENIEILEELALEAPLPVRVQVFLEAPSSAAELHLRQGQPPPVGKELLSVRGIKLYADGALGSWGAFLEEAYADEPTHHGIQRLPGEEMLHWLRLAKRSKFQVAIHALGDRAVRLAIDALSSVYSDSEDARRHRPRLEHLSVTRPEDRQRLAQLGIVASVQPGFLNPTAGHASMEVKRLGGDRENRLFAWKSMLQAGVNISGSSDSYGLIEPPLHGIYAAVTRCNNDGHPPGGWHPEERLTREEALRIYTQGGAYAGFEEKFKGSLEKGKWADLVILSADPLTCSDAELLQIQVLGTLVAGRFSYLSQEVGTK